MILPKIFATFLWLVHLACGQSDLPVSCVTRSCDKIAYGDCDLTGEYWAVYNYLGRRTCVCCKGEKDAAIAVGLQGHKTNGLFYGDRYKMCETVYIDQVSCYSRQTRDCNYHTMIHRNKFVGCFYCRPRCETDIQCQDIERVCGKCREDQPVPACTEPIFARIAREMKDGGNSSFSNPEAGDDEFLKQNQSSTDGEANTMSSTGQKESLTN